MKNILNLTICLMLLGIALYGQAVSFGDDGLKPREDKLGTATWAIIFVTVLLAFFVGGLIFQMEFEGNRKIFAFISLIVIVITIVILEYNFLPVLFRKITEL